MSSPSKQRYRFSQGVPAFEQDCEFVLTDEAEWGPFVTMGSEREGGPRFVCIEIAAVDPAYRVELSAEDAGSISALPGRFAVQGSGLRVLAIVAVMEDGTLTANFSAPVVLNPEAALGVQAVQAGSTYSPVTVIRSRQEGRPC